MIVKIMVAPPFLLIMEDLEVHGVDTRIALTYLLVSDTASAKWFLFVTLQVPLPAQIQTG